MDEERKRTIVTALVLYGEYWTEADYMEVMGQYNEGHTNQWKELELYFNYKADPKREWRINEAGLKLINGGQNDTSKDNT